MHRLFSFEFSLGQSGYIINAGKNSNKGEKDQSKNEGVAGVGGMKKKIEV